MAARVLNDLPCFADEAFCGMLLNSFVSPNSAIHGDALSMRSQYADLRNGPLELTLRPRSPRADAVAYLAIGSWKALGEFFNESDWVKQLIGERLRQVLRPRFDAAQRKKNKIVLTLDDFQLLPE